MRLVRGFIGPTLLAGAALAAPPPPPVFPKELPERLSGYDLRPIYQRYHFWVGRGREPALRKALPHEQQWRGKHRWGSVVFSEIDHYDFGVVRIDSLERYCAGNWLQNEPAGECDYRYRYAFVPGSLYSDETREKLILQSFRPQELTMLLAREGWAPANPNDVWTDNRLVQVFERHTDLGALYQPYVERHDVAASECPAFRQGLDQLDDISLSIDPDRPGDMNDAPPPHGQQTRIRLTATTTTGGRVTIAGSEPLFGRVRPIWAAVEACSPPSYTKKGAS